MPRRPTESRLRNVDYWDTSALFKLYFPETDSDWFITRFAAAREPVVTSEIAVVELYCNLLRNERMGRMAPGSAAAQFRIGRIGRDRQGQPDLREGKEGKVSA